MEGIIFGLETRQVLARFSLSFSTTLGNSTYLEKHTNAFHTSFSITYREWLAML